MKSANSLLVSILISTFISGAAISEETFFRVDTHSKLISISSNGSEAPEEPLEDTYISLQSMPTLNLTRGLTMDALDFKNLATINGNRLTKSDLNWSIGSNGSLPDGVNLIGSSIVGTPTTLGEGSFEIIASHPDAANEGSQTYTIKVNEHYLKVKDIGMDISHACAITTSGGVKCWGYNYYGQVGDGTTATRYSPTDVVGLSSGAVKLYVTNNRSCAMMENNELKCWGSNTGRVITSGDISDKYLTPVTSDRINGNELIELSHNQYTPCAIITGGGVKCWGSNASLWDPQSSSAAYLDPKVIFPSGYKSIVSRLNATCALSISNEVHCWGRANELNPALGELVSPGNPMILETNVRKIVGYGTRSCLLTFSGLVKCWGNEQYNALGNGSTYTNGLQYAPLAQVMNINNATDIIAGDGQFCAKVGSQFQCWGRNSYSNLRTASGNLMVPEHIPMFDNAKQIHMASGTTCIVTQDDEVECVGLNNTGQLADGMSVNKTSLAKVVVP